MRVILTEGDMQLELDPCAGGTVRRLKHRDLDVLRPGPDRCGPAFDARNYAAFPMVPFVGRIHEGRFELNGTCVELHANMPPEPHAIHGHGWQDVWKIETQNAASATLVYRHSACAWPWDYEARQSFTLSANQLRLDLSVTNKSDTAMPAGLGWHPYFDRENAKIMAPTVQAWASDEETGANTLQALSPCNDLNHAQLVEELTLDTSFSTGSEPIRMQWPTHSVTLQSDDIFSHATIYVPPHETYFCAEPISHAPNAVNSSLPADVTGLHVLAPGETLSGTITLLVEH